MCPIIRMYMCCSMLKERIEQFVNACTRIAVYKIRIVFGRFLAHIYRVVILLLFKAQLLQRIQFDLC